MSIAENSQMKMYKMLSFKEKVALYRGFRKTKSPHLGLRTATELILASIFITAMVFIEIHFQSVIWGGNGFPKLCSIGWWLIFAFSPFTFFLLGQDVERYREFNKWLAQEKNIIRGKNGK